ncbi:MAG: hypothetical protein Q9162_000792 [Coniocarpon cinnabarinum]
MPEKKIHDNKCKVISDVSIKEWRFDLACQVVQRRIDELNSMITGAGDPLVSAKEIRITNVTTHGSNTDFRPNPIHHIGGKILGKKTFFFYVDGYGEEGRRNQSIKGDCFYLEYDKEKKYTDGSQVIRGAL